MLARYHDMCIYVDGNTLELTLFWVVLGSPFEDIFNSRSVLNLQFLA